MAENNNVEEEMDLMSTGESVDVTIEDEASLLQGDGDDMAVDGTAGNQSMSQRKPIVFDLGRDSEDEEQEVGRDLKFGSERMTSLSLKQNPKSKEIPDTLDCGPRTEWPPSWKAKKRNRNRSFGGISKDRYRPFQPKTDLRHFINQTKRQPSLARNNPLFRGLGVELNPLQSYQMNVGILNPVIAQNQLLMTALLAQRPNNPLLSRLQVGGQSLASFQKPLNTEDLQITIHNTNVVKPNPTKTQTKSNFRYLVKRDVTPTAPKEPEIKGMPSMSSAKTEKPQLKTLFAKHLETKTKESSNQSTGGLFGDALAEVEVGVDNEYLRKMEEMEKKRREILKMKEEKRLAAADQRFESAMKLKEKINV